MKILFFSQFLLIAGCASMVGTKKSYELMSGIVGLYEYLPDSSDNPNRNFFESIDLKKDYTFSYKSRMGEFIRIELSGSWILDGGQVVLKSDYQKENIFKPADCSMKLQKRFSFDVKDLNGNYFNYDLIIDGKVKKGLYGKIILDSIPSIK